MIDLLSPARAERLRTAPLTYPDVGATAEEVLPAGYRVVRQQRRIGGIALAEAADLLLGWQVHERVGLRVAASHPRASTAVVLTLRIGVGPLAITAPCRVVGHVDEADRAGFTYGTLAGHPESGEERFDLERDGDGVVFTITAFSRHGSWFARLGSPIATRVQDMITRRYLSALEPG